MKMSSEKKREKKAKQDDDRKNWATKKATETQNLDG